MLETKDEWLVHGFSFANYLTELGDKAQSDIYSKSSVDLALRDAFRKMRRFLMTTKKLTEDEAISLITIGVDFGIRPPARPGVGLHPRHRPRQRPGHRNLIHPFAAVSTP